MIQYLLFCAPKLLNISDITKRIGNFFKLPIQFFKTVLIPNSRREEGTDVNVIIAKILLDHFGKFMSDEHKDAMRRELTKYEDATTPMQKSECASKLVELNDKYGLFVSGFLLNISGHDESNPVRANKALVAYNQFMAALNEGNVSRARDILDANQDLIGTDTVFSVSNTTGIGQN